MELSARSRLVYPTDALQITHKIPRFRCEVKRILSADTAQPSKLIISRLEIN